MTEFVSVDRSDYVLELTLNRPAKRNALNAEMRSAIVRALSAERLAATRVVTLRASGPVFCAGMDLRERVDSAAPHSGSAIAPVLEAVQKCPVPVVAVVQGDALAGGCELALSCDFVVASSAAHFGMPLARLGLAPSWPLVKALLDVLGLACARDMLFRGAPISAARLHRSGAISQVVSPARLESEAHKLVTELCSRAPLTLMTVKATLRKLHETADVAALSELDPLIARVRSSEDAIEGVQAQLQKRSATFRGM